MKYILIVPDGMADRPLPELGGRTPLEAARTPNMDYLARFGTCGSTNNTPRDYIPDSVVANMSILGLDPRRYPIRRGPLEAVVKGLKLPRKAIIFRMNFVTVRDGRMKDFTAGHITTVDATKLIDGLGPALAKKFGPGFNLVPGVSYRNLCVFSEPGLLARPEAGYPAAHDITDRPIAPHLPKADDLIGRIMAEAHRILSDRKFNRTEATHIWLYGQGPVLPVPSFKTRFGLTGAMITAVDLLKGIGKSIGLEILKVPGITSYFDTNYSNKAKYGLRALEKNDFVFIHIEAPDEAGHQGDIAEKIRAIENIDRRIVGYILDRIRFKDYRILLLPDHATPICLKTHCHDDIPFVMFDSRNRHGGVCPRFDEKIVETRGKIPRFREGYKLIDAFLKEQRNNNR